MTRILGSVLLALALAGCSIPLTSDNPPPAPSPTATTTASTQPEPEVEDESDTQPEEAEPVALSKCVEPTNAETKRVAAVVQALGYGGNITRTAAVRFGNYAVVATYIANSETAPGQPKADRKATWLVSTNANGKITATEVADAWHNISDEVQTPGREAQKRALGCIS